MISGLSSKVSSHFKTILYTGFFSLALASTSNAARVSVNNWQHCGKTVDIKTHLNNFNNNYLSATSDLGKLSVRTGKDGTTKFTIQCFTGDNKIALKTSQNRYVVAVGDTIKADRTKVGNWEKFEVHTGNSSGRFAFKSSHGKYMVAEPNRTVKADRTKIGSYESFVLESGGSTSGGGDTTKGIINADEGYARKEGSSYPKHKPTNQIGNAIYDGGLSASALCFNVSGTKICASDFKHSVKSSAGGHTGDKAPSRKFAIPKRSGSDYSLIAVSGGGPHFNRNNERTRVRIDSSPDCHIIGHRGGDDKSLYLVKRKNNNSCHFTSDGATQFMNISTSGKKLTLMCGNTLDPMYDQKPTAFSPRLKTGEMAIFGGDDPEHSSTRIKNLNDAINPSESSRKAMFFPENKKFSFDDHIIFTQGNPSGLYGSNGMKRNGAFLILKVGNEEGDTGKITKDSAGHNNCVNK